MTEVHDLDGDDWREINKARQDKRAQNRQSSPEVLRQHGIAFESQNAGAHLIVSHAGRIFDFWPGTGRFIERGQGKCGYGVFRLIDVLNGAV